MRKSTYKVPDGKMLKIRLTVSGDRIDTVTIMGDFFLHPEETVLELEENLKGHEINVEKLSDTIAQFLTAKQAVLIGAKPQDVAQAILMAYTSKKAF